MIRQLTASLEFHGQSLLLRAERQRLIAGNIANADTPGYKARDFDFAATLRAATAGRQGAGGPAAAGGIGQGIGQGIAAGVMTESVGRAAHPTLRYVQPVQTNLDSNSVDMDRERGNFMDNALKFDATLRFINGSVRTTLEAMRSHNQG